MKPDARADAVRVEVGVDDGVRVDLVDAVAAFDALQADGLPSGVVGLRASVSPAADGVGGSGLPWHGGHEGGRGGGDGGAIDVEGDGRRIGREAEVGERVRPPPDDRSALDLDQLGQRSLTDALVAAQIDQQPPLQRGDAAVAGARVERAAKQPRGVVQQESDRITHGMRYNSNCY